MQISAYNAYDPATRGATIAATEFIDKMDSWSDQIYEAQKSLKQACVDLSGEAKPIAYLSKDPLNMSVFGIIFDKPPASGFIPAPTSVTQAARESGSRGLAYIPDVKTKAGRSVFDAMIKLSSVGETRPLLQIPGVEGIQLDAKNLAMACAVRTDDGIKIFAKPSAVKNTSELVASPQDKPTVDVDNRPRSSLLTPPSPFNEH